MATVKLSGGKVLLKGGKVSCTCCGDCCLYPANMLDAEGGYAAADLPDALTVTSSQPGASGNYPRSGSSFVLAGGGAFQIINTGDNWKLENSATHEEVDVGFEGCLITGDGNLTPGNDTVEDQFEAEYIVTPSESGFAESPWTLDRVSACRWAHSFMASEWQKYTIKIYWDRDCCKWACILQIRLEGVVNTGGEYIVFGAKDSPQSDPVGTYNAPCGAFGPIGSSILTVSAP